MKQSTKLLQEYEAIRKRIISEIIVLIVAHANIEMDVEFDKPVFYAHGYDEQDDPHAIEEVKVNGDVIVYYQGDISNIDKLENLETHTLLKVLEELEKSLDGAKEFLQKTK